MKCENCGKNEVTFVYQSNVNGHVEERRLCSDCAEKLGYSQKIAAHNQKMQSLFGDTLFGESIFGEPFFRDFLTPMPSLMGRMSRMLEDPFDDFFREMPALSASAPETERKQEEPQRDDLVNQEDQSRFSYLRKRNALKMEQKQAIHQENFERAAQLRDEIKALEEEHRESK